MQKGEGLGLTKLSSFCHLWTPELCVKLVCPGAGKSFIRDINKKHGGFLFI